LQLECQNQKAIAEGELERQATEITNYANTQAAKLRTDGADRARRAREIADEVYADYQNHEDADDVREALDELASEAATRFGRESETAPGRVRKRAALWRSKGPQKSPVGISHKDTDLSKALVVVPKAVTTAHADLDASIGPLIVDIQNGLITVTAGVDENTAFL